MIACMVCYMLHFAHRFGNIYGETLAQCVNLRCPHHLKNTKYIPQTSTIKGKVPDLNRKVRLLQQYQDDKQQALLIL